MPPDAPRVVITGVGARGTLGDHAVQLAASLRAGLTRLREWPWYETREGPLVAAFTDPDLQDRPWHEKVLDLLELPLAEALGAAAVDDLEDATALGRVRAFVATPSFGRPGSDPDAVATLAGTLAEDLFGEGTRVALELAPADHAAGVLAMARACEALQRGSADLCLVAGVDSWLEGGVLDALFEADRLQRRGHPGLVPGEAGAVLVLETAASARRRRARVRAGVDAVVLEREDAAFDPGAPLTGRTLARAVERAATSAGGAARLTRIAVDLNGERWRFLDWALAESRVSDALPDGWRLWHPAEGVGDVGAASVPLAAAVATRAFARGYAGGGKVLVAASSETGERGAVVLSPPEEA